MFYATPFQVLKFVSHLIYISKYKSSKKKYSAFSELFGYSFNKYLLRIYDVPGIVVGVVNKSNTSFYL